ncbi:MAG: hypothetical protein J6U01_05805 [Clostridia bacterium]|nr:hypothetical protein [Clostridia bacterium]
MSDKELKAKGTLNEHAAELNPEDLDQVTGGSAVNDFIGIFQVQGGEQDAGGNSGRPPLPGVSRISGKVGLSISKGGNA